MSVRSASSAALHGAGSIVDRLLERPREVLGALILGQIVGTIVLGLSVAHNGWVWFQGGDQIWMTTTGWLLGRLELPPTEIAYLWPLVQAPMTWVTGSTFVQLLPILVVLQVLLLGPVALLCFYGIASRIGGRLLGYWAALLWVVTPYLSIPLWVDRYQERWAEQFLPQALGLTAMADFPSMVLALAAAYFVVRSLEPERMRDAVFAGALLGAAGALKPANMLLAAGVALAYVVARHWREGAACAAAAAPALLVLLAWKVKGLGEIPAFALGQAHIAVGSGPLALDLSISRYFDFDLDHWRQQMDQLREFFWSARLAQWAPFAGLLAVLRVRRGAIAALLAGWLAAFIVIKGFSPRASIESNTFWRLLLPAWPAYLLLFASIPLLIPTLPRRLGERVQPAVGTAPVAWRWIAVTAALTVALPADAGGRPGLPGQQHPDAGGRGDPRRRRTGRLRPPDHLGRRHRLESGRLLPRLPLRRHRRGPRVPPLRGHRVVLHGQGRSGRHDAGADVPRPVRPRRRDVPDRHRHELDRRPRGRRRVRVQSAGGFVRLTRSSSRAMRCARSTFSSVSLEITVE